MGEYYIDRFTSPEEFIRAELLANRGSDSIVTKYTLASIAGWKARDGEFLTSKTKEQLLDLIIEQYGQEAYTMFPVGVDSICFQRKFGIEHKDVLKLAKAGVLHVTGERKFRKFGKYLYAKTYSAYDFFQLTTEEVHKQLEKLQRETRTSAKS